MDKVKNKITIRTIVTSDREDVSITIPKKYIGRKLEVLLYAVDELTEEERVTEKLPASKFQGLLSEEEPSLQS